MVKIKYCFQVSGRERGKARSVTFRKKERRRALIMKIRPNMKQSESGREKGERPAAPSFLGLNPQNMKKAGQGFGGVRGGEEPVGGHRWELPGGQGQRLWPGWSPQRPDSPAHPERSHWYGEEEGPGRQEERLEPPGRDTSHAGTYRTWIEAPST